VEPSTIGATMGAPYVGAALGGMTLNFEEGGKIGRERDAGMECKVRAGLNPKEGPLQLESYRAITRVRNVRFAFPFVNLS
jgi:hypothetical protein